MYHAEITTNGAPAHTLSGVTIATLLRARGIFPVSVAVALNGRALTPGETKATPIGHGDVLEVLCTSPRDEAGVNFTTPSESRSTHDRRVSPYPPTPPAGYGGVRAV